MKLTKKNRSAIRSQQLLTEAFFELLRENPHKRIQIKTLCERAGVVRATFYAHYQTINDIPYAYYVNEWVEKLLLMIDKNLKKNLSVDEIYFLGSEWMFEYWGNEVEIYKLLSAAGMDNTIAKLIHFGTDSGVKKFLENRSEPIDPMLLEYYIKQSANTIFATYCFWVKTGMKKTVSEMAEILNLFISFDLLEELVKRCGEDC